MALLSDLDSRILNDFQRDLPLDPTPFATMAAQIGVGEAVLIERLIALRANGTMARVGATCRPNTVGASTLAALAVPEWRLDAVAEIVGSERGVNHSYLREHDWNLWFVATAPSAGALAELLARISKRTRLEVLDLPLVRAFNIDLGFALDGPRHVIALDRPADTSVIEPGDRALLQALTDGLPLVPRPFAALGVKLGLNESNILARIKLLTRARIITRMGVIVRHRALGWRSNAMVAWNLPDDRIGAAGEALVRHPGVTLCYQRVRRPNWDYPLFTMIHAKSRAEAQEVLAGAMALPELEDAQNRVLFSVRCFKQTGAMIGAPTMAAE